MQAQCWRCYPAAVFKKVRFVRTILHEADLRRCSFEDCDFSGAAMKGAKLTRLQANELRLSAQQMNEIDWQFTDSEEPDGG
jgi:uncharacterized protein YjbI with pentapeptide repeats